MSLSIPCPDPISLFSTDVHQGEADWPCNEGGACWQQEQGDGGGCRHGGHGLCHQHTAQGETERKREILNRKRECYVC